MLRRYDMYLITCYCVLSIFLLSQTIILCCNAFHNMIVQQRHKSFAHQKIYNNTSRISSRNKIEKFIIFSLLKGSINDNDNNEIINNKNNNSMNQSSSSSSSLTTVDEIEKLRLQAKQLRDDIINMRIDINMTAIDKEIRRKQKIDQWLNHLLINETIISTTTDDNDDVQDDEKTASSTTIIERINDVSHVVYILINDRYSPEQVFDIFERLCETTSITGRDSIQSNVLLQTLLDAVNIMDSMEREENDNKRWKSIVERTLHKRLFAKEWNINLDTVQEQEYQRNYGKLL